MLPANELTLAIDLHARSYKLLRWIADGIEKGFLQPWRVHEYTVASQSAYDWMEQHYLNLPVEARPEPHCLREFANYFSTYITTSFDFVQSPGRQIRSYCGCYCPLCTYMGEAPNLRTKKLQPRDKNRARTLMADRVFALSREEGVSLTYDQAESLAANDDTRRAAGYSAYGEWLIRRLEGDSDGKAVLALWRIIAWNSTGSPIPGFRLAYADFVDAEELLIAAMRE